MTKQQFIWTYYSAEPNKPIIEKYHLITFSRKFIIAKLSVCIGINFPVEGIRKDVFY